jgi:hypothetical protein
MNILQNVKQLIARRASLQKELDKIDNLLAPLGAGNGAGLKMGRGGRRRRMSAAAKAKLSAAAKARWKKAKAAGRSRL